MRRCWSISERGAPRLSTGKCLWWLGLVMAAAPFEQRRADRPSYAQAGIDTPHSRRECLPSRLRHANAATRPFTLDSVWVRQAANFHYLSRTQHGAARLSRRRFAPRDTPNAVAHPRGRLPRDPSHPSLQSFNSRQLHPGLSEVPSYEVVDIIKALKRALLLAHHMGDVTAPQWTARVWLRFFDPYLDDKRMCVFLVDVHLA